MNNMGGLNRLFVIDAADFISLVKDANGLHTLTLTQGKTPTEIKFTQDTGRISEAEEETDNGTAYNYDASIRVPKCAVENADILSEFKGKKIMIMGQDNNESWWLTGAPGSYFNINTGSDTGTASADMNGRSVKISSQLSSGSVFINPIV